MSNRIEETFNSLLLARNLDEQERIINIMSAIDVGELNDQEMITYQLFLETLDNIRSQPRQEGDIRSQRGKQSLCKRVSDWTYRAYEKVKNLDKNRVSLGVNVAVGVAAIGAYTFGGLWPASVIGISYLAYKMNQLPEEPIMEGTLPRSMKKEAPIEAAIRLTDIKDDHERKRSGEQEESKFRSSRSVREYDAKHGWIERKRELDEHDGAEQKEKEAPTSQSDAIKFSSYRR